MMMTRIRNNNSSIRSSSSSSMILLVLLLSLFNNKSFAAVDNTNNDYHGYETVIINCHGPHHHHHSETTTTFDEDDDSTTIAILEDTFLTTYQSLVSTSLPVEFVDAEIITDEMNEDDEDSYSFILRLYYVCRSDEGCNPNEILPLFSHPSLVEEGSEELKLPTATFFTNVYRNELSLKLLALEENTSSSEANEQSLLFQDIVWIEQEQEEEESVVAVVAPEEEEQSSDEEEEEEQSSIMEQSSISYDLSKRTPFTTIPNDDDDDNAYGIVITMHKDVVLIEEEDLQKMILMLLERVFVDAYNTMMTTNHGGCYDAPYFRKLYTATASILPNNSDDDEQNAYILFNNFAGSCLECDDKSLVRLFNDDNTAATAITLVEGTNNDGDDIISCTSTTSTSADAAAGPSKEEFHRVFQQTLTKVIPGQRDSSSSATDNNVVVIEEEEDDDMNFKIIEIQSFSCSSKEGVATVEEEEEYHQLVRIDMMGIPADLILINENEMMMNSINIDNPSSYSIIQYNNKEEDNNSDEKKESQEFMEEAILTRLNEFELERAFMEVYNGNDDDEQQVEAVSSLQEQLTSSSCNAATTTKKSASKTVTGARFVAIVGKNTDGSKTIYDYDHGKINLYNHIKEEKNNNLRRRRKLQRGYERPTNIAASSSIPYSVILNVTYTCNNDDCTSPLFTTEDAITTAHTKFINEKVKEGLEEMNYHGRTRTRRNLLRHHTSSSLSHRFMASHEEEMCYCNLNIMNINNKNDDDDSTPTTPSILSSEEFTTRYYQNLITKYDLHGIQSITNVVSMMENDDDEEGDPSEDVETLEQNVDVVQHVDEAIQGAVQYEEEQEEEEVVVAHVDEAIQGAVQYEEEEEVAAVDESIQDALEYYQQNQEEEETAAIDESIQDALVYQQEEEEQKEEEEVVAFNVGAAIQNAILFEKTEDEAIQDVLDFEDQEEAEKAEAIANANIDAAIQDALNFQKNELLVKDVISEVDEEDSSSCQDDDSIFFYVSLGNNQYGPKQKVTCYWLRHHIERLNELCEEDIISNTCAYTCAKCTTDEEEPIDYFEESDDEEDEDEYSYDEVMATRSSIISSSSLENHMELLDEEEDVKTMATMMGEDEDEEEEEQNNVPQQDPITSAAMDTIYHHHQPEKDCTIPNVNKNKVRFPLIRSSDCQTTLVLINDAQKIPDCCTMYGIRNSKNKRTVVLNDGHNCIEDDDGTDQALIDRWSQSYIDEKNNVDGEEEKIPVLEGLCLSRGYYKVKL